MKTLALSRTVLFGEPPRRYVVTFAVGSRFVRVVGPGRGGPKVERIIEWHGEDFRPGCVAMTEQAIACFRELDASQQPDDRTELGNEELMIAGRLPEKPRGKLDYHERQLPASDRMGVG